MLPEKLLDRRVDLAGGDTWSRERSRQLVRLPNQESGLAHHGDFPGRPQYLHSSYPPSSRIRLQNRPHAVKDFIDARSAVNRLQQPLLTVVFQQRLRLFPIGH